MSKGYRGYLFSRPISGHRVPQHIQNLVMRDYCARHGLVYKLGAVEYAMPGSFLILEQIADDLPNLEGIVLYSMFMLPPDPAERSALYRRIIDAGCGLHAAVEGFRLTTPADVERWDNVLNTAEICHAINYADIERWLA